MILKKNFLTNLKFDWYNKKKILSSKQIYKNYSLYNFIYLFFIRRNFLLNSFNIHFFDKKCSISINLVKIFDKFLDDSKNYLQFKKKIKFSSFSFFKFFFNDLIKNNFEKKKQLKIYKKLLFIVKNILKEKKETVNNLFIILQIVPIKFLLKKNKISLKKLDEKKLIENNDLGFNFNKLKKIIKKYLKIENLIIDVKLINNKIILADHLRNSSIFYFFIINQVRYILFILRQSKNLSSLLLASFIKINLENRRNRKKHKYFLKIVRKFIIQNKDKLSILRGLKIVVAGRINGRNRSTKYTIEVGNMPLQTISIKKNYTFLPAYTMYGVFGIKVWIF